MIFNIIVNVICKELNIYIIDYQYNKQLRNFSYLTYDKRWEKLELDLFKKYQNKFGKIPNETLAKKLFRMKIIDQAFFYHIDVCEKQLPNESLLSRAIWELKLKLNQENKVSLLDIVKKDGWPKASDVTPEGAEAAFLIVQHMDDIEIQKYFLPIIYEAAKSGDAKMSNYAYLADRVNLKEGKLQLFGTQIMTGPDGISKVDNLFEPQYVNQRRKEVGLGSIQDYVSRFGISWSIEQLER